MASKREGKNLLQRSQLCQHSEFRHVSVSERLRSHLCGQNLCGAFVRAVLAKNFEKSDRAMAADGTTKALVSPPLNSEFKHQNCMVRTVHVIISDHDGAVRIFVRHSYHSN